MPVCHNCSIFFTLYFLTITKDVLSAAYIAVYNPTIPNKKTYTERCGYGPRLPFLVISPWAKVNFVDHTLTDQTSILRFIEDNWHLGRIGNNSYDSKAGTVSNMFNFTAGYIHANSLFLDPNSGMSIIGRK